jgi:hypothetical protein
VVGLIHSPITPRALRSGSRGFHEKTGLLAERSSEGVNKVG